MVFGANAQGQINLSSSPYPELDLAAEIGRSSKKSEIKCQKVYSKCPLSTVELKKKVLEFKLPEE
jgi:hypothetical protein